MTEPITGDTAPESPQVDTDGADAGQTAARADEQTDDVDTAPDTEGQGDELDTPGDDPESSDEAPNDRASRDFGKLRAQLAEKDTAIADLGAQLQAMRMAEVQRIASQPGPIPEGSRDARPALTPAALEASGLDMAALLDETGAINTGALEAHLAGVAAAFGIKSLQGFTPDRGQGAGGNPPIPATPTIADQFRRH